MQQKLCSRGSGSFLSERNGQACGASPSSLPFRCPRCGEQERFRSLASLRAHLEYRHAYCSPDVTSGGFSITGKLPDPDSRDSGFLPSYGSVRRRTQSVGVGTQAEEEDDDEEDDEEEFGSDDDDVGDDDEDEGEEKNGGRNDRDIKKSDTCPHRLNHQLFHPPAPLAPPPYPNLDLDLELVDQNQYSGLQTAAASAAVRRRLASLLRAADSTMQRRLAKVSTELAQTDTQLLCERAHSQHLAQERQEVADRERSLSRQVDVAVMVIAALREQLNASENELERQEREVITIQKFLEAAARQETCGKVRIQHFIENLLRRIALAERLVEYYQENSPRQCSHYKYQQPSEHTPHRITKSRSAGGQLSSSGIHEHRTHSHSSSSQFGGRPLFSRAGGAAEREHRERLAQSSRLFCRPEHRDDIWNHQRRRSAGYEA
ncbi:hypothetical protein CesoFtcFv8_021344 [Champsocephalus esox]|uniref:FBX41/ZN365 C2H2-type zinc finger domain-containing protein n=1 Tax=Champsocephalus esox TaxID=159716 RepID=A0AAN8BE23_9TELE|nr:hypothetical protein CesoFtcFv8_021344 [Champsocephalus esox]